MNNKVTLIGEIKNPLTYSHTTFSGERMFAGEISVKRSSGCFDYIPLIVSEKLITCHLTGRIFIEGEFRSVNKRVLEKGNTPSKLLLYVFANTIYPTEVTEDLNELELRGFLIKTPQPRTTPLGRRIADLILAVNRPYPKSDYLPLIIWGRNADFISHYGAGTEVQVSGRIQSREYSKTSETGETSIKTAYEVSVKSLSVISTKTNT